MIVSKAFHTAQIIIRVMWRPNPPVNILWRTASRCQVLAWVWFGVWLHCKNVHQSYFKQTNKIKFRSLALAKKLHYVYQRRELHSPVFSPEAISYIKKKHFFYSYRPTNYLFHGFQNASAVSDKTLFKLSLLFVKNTNKFLVQNTKIEDRVLHNKPISLEGADALTSLNHKRIDCRLMHKDRGSGNSIPSNQEHWSSHQGILI